MITLGQLKKNNFRPGQRKTFRGWVHIHSKSGSDWEHYNRWLIVSGPYPKKIQAKEAMHSWRHTDCCPCHIVKLYL